ncbi:hypothetical protein EYC54_22450 [Xanthomonas oryzae]|nr:hypothetical protein [Xanthomonas oryzae]QBG89863.1 hypothetical protein EYC54_22450 [Xanthomonas oryzae]
MLVEQTVTLPDGTTTTALVPKVYLRPRAGDVDKSDALLAGADVHIHASGGVINSDDVAGRRLVTVDAGRIDHQDGGRISG